MKLQFESIEELIEFYDKYISTTRTQNEIKKERERDSNSNRVKDIQKESLSESKKAFESLIK